MAVRSISHESFDPKTNPPSSPSLLRRLSVIAQGHRPRVSSPHQTFTPRFDLDELDTTYELYAELPGAKKERISVKTVDAYNLEVFGNVVRHSIETPKAELVLTPSDGAINPLVKIWTPELALPASPLSGANSRHNSFAPVIREEEENEEDGGILTKTHGRAYIYAEADTELRRQEEAVEDPVQVKRLITECQYGDFYRKFRFTQPIDTTAVTARFEDGVLHVTIPKGV